MKMPLHIYLSFFFLPWAGGMAYAQQGNLPGIDSLKLEKINVFTDVPVNQSRSASLPSDKKNTSADWSIKCNPFILSRGEVPVYLERRLSTDWSMEVALGVTFADYLKEVVLKGRPLIQKDANVSRLSGICGKLDTRYYTGHNTSEGLYVALEADFTSYRKDVKGVYLDSDGRYTNGQLRDKQEYLDGVVILGWKISDPSENDFSFDWFIGAGVRSGMEDNVVPDELNANVIRINRTEVLNPLVTLGLKIGLDY
jgi:hypothetical protein